MGNLNNRLRSADVRFSKLKMPKFTHFSMEANGSQCIRTGARRKTCVASLVECPCNNVRFQSRSSIVSMVLLNQVTYNYNYTVMTLLAFTHLILTGGGSSCNCWLITSSHGSQKANNNCLNHVIPRDYSNCIYYVTGFAKTD